LVVVEAAYALVLSPIRAAAINIVHIAAFLLLVISIIG
jgi:hypothetical protein